MADRNLPFFRIGRMLLIVKDPRQRIVEDCNGFLETHTVFPLIGLSFARVPLECQLHEARPANPEELSTLPLRNGRNSLPRPRDMIDSVAAEVNILVEPPTTHRLKAIPDRGRVSFPAS